MSDTPLSTRVRLTQGGWVWLGVAVVLAVVGWYKTINLLLLLGYVLVALLGVNAWSAWRTARRPTARRLPTDPVFPGEELAVGVVVSNHTDHPATALVADAAGGRPVSWLLAQLAPREERPLVARWTFAARGRFRLGPLALEAAHPFGVVQARRELAPDAEALVLPATGTADLEMFRWWLIRGGAGDGQGRKPARRAAPGQGDVRGVRPYRTGDSPRDVHWRTSARRGQLLVREYDRPEPLDLVLVLDPWLPADAGREPAERLEWAVGLAATLARSWCDLDEPADLCLVVPGLPPRVRAGRATPRFAREALVVLADLAGAADVPLVPAGVIRRQSNRTARLVVSSRPRSPVAEALRRAGLPFAAVDPSDPPRWFVAPSLASTG